MALIGDDPSPSLLGNGPDPNGTDKTYRSGKPPKNSLLSQAKANKGGGSLTADTHNPGNKWKSQRSKPQTGQGGGKLNQSIKGRSKSNRRHGQNEQGEKASSSKRALTGTAVGALLFGAGGAATGAAIVGGTAGVVALGSTVTFGLIGAAAGSAVPVVGTIIGAGVGLLVGALVGHIYGRASAETANADYLDTRPNAPGNRLQRSSNWAWIRATAPENLGKRGLRLAKPARRWWVWRICINAKRLCVSISDDKKALKFEARGHNATADEARRDLRYAVAAELAFSETDIEDENYYFEVSKNTNVFRRTEQRSANFYSGYTTDPKKISLEQIKNIVLPPRSGGNELYRENPDKWYRKEYKECYEEMKSRYQYVKNAVKAVRDHPKLAKWDFKTIGPDADARSPEYAIFKMLPEGLQESLTKGGGVFRDSMSGTNARFLYDQENNEVIIAFNGTAGSLHEPSSLLPETAREQNYGNATNYLGGEASSVRQAELLGAAVRDAVAEYNDMLPPSVAPVSVVSTGHSRGGLLASREAVTNRGKAITFNPMPWSAGVRDGAGLYSSEVVPNEVEIINYSVRNDWVSGSGLGSGVGNMIETATGIGMPAIYGERRILPKAPGWGAHPDPVAHMCHLIAGGKPPRKAFWRWGPEVDDPRLYMAQR